MFEFPEVPVNDRWDYMTVTLGEWYEMGFYNPLDDESWRFDAYSDLQYTQLCRKIIERFYYREVSIPTPARWKKRARRMWSPKRI